jgi:hypothetical protein
MFGPLDLRADSSYTLLSVSILPKGGSLEEFLKKSGKKR